MCVDFDLAVCLGVCSLCSLLSYHTAENTVTVIYLHYFSIFHKGTQTIASSLIDLSAVLNHSYIIFVSTSDVHDSINNHAEADALSSVPSFIFNYLFRQRIIKTCLSMTCITEGCLLFSLSLLTLLWGLKCPKNSHRNLSINIQI